MQSETATPAAEAAPPPAAPAADRGTTLRALAGRWETLLVALVVVVCAGFYLRSYRSGRELYAIGSDPAAARLSGIPVGRRVFAAFVASGTLAGLAGVLYAARFGTLDANAGLGQELEVVAAVGALILAAIGLDRGLAVRMARRLRGRRRGH